MAEDFESRCRSAAESESWDQVLSTALQWREWRPKTSKPWLFLAEGYHESNEPQKAAVCLGSIPLSSSKAVPALVKKSQIEFDVLNLPLASEKTCLQVLELDPRLAEIHRRLIFLYALSLQKVNLVQQIRDAISRNAEPPEAYAYLMLSGDLFFQNAFELNSRWLESSPESEVFRIAALVSRHEHLCRLAKQSEASIDARHEAFNSLQQELQNAPHSLTLLRHLLTVYTREAKVDEVGRILETAPLSAAADSVIWRTRGWYHSMVNDMPQAEKAYRKSLELMSLDWRTWNGLSEALRALGKLEEGEKCQRLALIGKKISDELLRLPTTRDISDEQLHGIMVFARECGEDDVAKQLYHRLLQRGYELQLRLAATPKTISQQEVERELSKVLP